MPMPTPTLLLSLTSTRRSPQSPTSTRRFLLSLTSTGRFLPSPTFTRRFLLSPTSTRSPSPSPPPLRSLPLLWLPPPTLPLPPWPPIPTATPLPSPPLPMPTLGTTPLLPLLSPSTKLVTTFTRKTKDGQSLMITQDAISNLRPPTYQNGPGKCLKRKRRENRCRLYLLRDT